MRLTQHHSSGHVQFGNLKVKKITHPHDLLNAEDVYSEEVKISPVKDNGAKGYVETAYTILAEDIFEHKSQTPNFHDAVKLHRLLDAVRKSAKIGKKVLLIN